jgi:APA family basic amino acid/polyamine antiporter
MSGTLQRTLGVRDLVLIVIGTVIGSGIFIVPSAVLRQTGGSVGVALGVWLFAGVLSLLGALTYGELGAMDKGSGGLYAYVRDAFGPFPAFLYGWTLFFVISSGSVATLAVAAASYVGQFVALGPVGLKVVAVLMIVLVAMTNIRGTRESASLQNVTTAIKVGAILVMSVLLLVAGRAAGGGAPPASLDAPASMISGVGLAMISVLWAYEGWQYVTFAAGESVDPQRSFPRALLIGTTALIAIYLLANVAYVAALGPEGVMRSDRVAADAVAAAFGPTAAKAIALAIIISMFSAANGLTLTAPRAYYTMARDGNFFARLAEVHPRFGTPAFAIGASSAWACALALSGTFEQLLTYVVFVGWIFYALGAIAVFVFRRARPDAERPYRVPGYPVTPLLFVLSAAAIVGNTIVSQPVRAAIGIGVVLVGAPAYLIWRRSGGRAAPLASPATERPGGGVGRP